MKLFKIKKKESEKILITKLVVPAMENVYSRKGHQKQLGILIKTLNLFDLSKDQAKAYTEEYLNKFNIKMDKEYRRVNKFVLDSIGFNNSSIVEDYFYFVLQKVKDEDLIYKNDKNILHREVKYYLYRLTKKILEASISGKAKLRRNYFLATGFKNQYKKMTGRALNRDKIAHLNKILEKYEYIVKDDDNYSYIGMKNPFFYCTYISNACKHYIKNMPKKEKGELNNAMKKVSTSGPT
jgi:hypothetical protein